TGRPPSALLGHSFGGKVVLEALEEGEGPDTRGRGDGTRQAWIVDSTPSAREPGGSAVRMLRAVRSLPERFSSREEAVGGLEEQGFARPVARWMTTNLERGDGGFRWSLDWSAMEALLEDFFRKDLWPVLEEPPDGWEVHVVKAEDSAVLPEEACDRIRDAGRRTGRVFLHRLSGGHWLNADNPDGVVDLLAEELP
ncbi:MAG: alpha/beta fold hydrolase, partial [Gemmatimonadota bacterium]